MSGVWIVELAELDTIRLADVATIKAFMSRRSDRFRPPYGKRLVDLPRQCVFAGTVNPEGGYLKDVTGARRFWPVKCGAIDLDSLRRDRDQLWAEAYQLWKRGEPWWLDQHSFHVLAADEQDARYRADAWEEKIEAWLAAGKSCVESEGTVDRAAPGGPIIDVSVGEVLEAVFHIAPMHWTQPDQNRVARCLLRLGFVQYRSRHPDGRRERRYRKPHGG